MQAIILLGPNCYWKVVSGDALVKYSSTTLFKRDSDTDASSGPCKIFQKSIFIEHLWTAASACLRLFSLGHSKHCRRITFYQGPFSRKKHFKIQKHLFNDSNNYKTEILVIGSLDCTSMA